MRRAGPKMTMNTRLSWSKSRLAEAEAYARRIGSSTVAIVQGGRTVAAWGDVARKSDVASVRKSLLSALIGIAVHEGRVRLDQTLAELGIDDRPPGLTDAEKEATVADLLTSRSGVYHPVDLEPPAIAAERPKRGSHHRGTFWHYNNWDFNVLGTIYERVAGEGLFDAFTRRIAEPIGLQDFTVADGRWGAAEKSRHPAYGFRMSARDLARFGELYLRGGEWGGKPVIPADWVAESTRPHAAVRSAHFPGRGYGYMWWTGFASDFAPTVTLPPGTFYALGFGAQYVFVMPTLDLVVVHTVDIERERWPWINDYWMGRLLWLILAAGGASGIGPDTALPPAHRRLAGDALRVALSGRTVCFADAAPDGPYFMRLMADGSATQARGNPREVTLIGKWWIEDELLCRAWGKHAPHVDRWPVAIDGAVISLYGGNDTMWLQGLLLPAIESSFLDL
jgi:CubicO group peptidase (beta-lactamase class C family)